MEVKIEKVHKHLGAIVSGIDLSRNLSSKNISLIKKAFLDNSVIIFNNQVLSPKNHIILTEIFGAIDIHPLKQFHLKDFPEILVLSNLKTKEDKPLGLEDAGRYWHTDVSFTNKPSLGSILYAKEIPAKGGDTLFSSQYAAWDILPKNWKTKLSNLQAWHGLNSTTAPKWTKKQLSAVKPVQHPLIRTHPETGKKAIYAGMFLVEIDNIDKKESDQIIKYLYDHCSKQELIYRHKWKKNDLVIWDNRCILHHATDFPRELSRHLHRTTIQGDSPF